MSGLCAVNECTSLCSFLSVKGTLCKISLAHVDFGLVSLNCEDTSRAFLLQLALLVQVQQVQYEDNKHIPNQQYIVARHSLS